MTVAALPDVTGALIERLRSFPEVAALTSTRISATMPPSNSPQAWPMLTYAVLLAETGGPPRFPHGLLRAQRFDLRVYGPDGRSADLLWRTLDACLCPLPNGVQSRSWKASNGTLVVDVAPESEPIRRTDADTEWAWTWCPYVVVYSPLVRA